MSSSVQECFVYIALPGETEFVTAGRFQLSTDRHGIATGRFVYGRSYLARDNAVPIDPIELKLERRVLRDHTPPRRVRRAARCESRLMGPPHHRKTLWLTRTRGARLPGLFTG